MPTSFYYTLQPGNITENLLVLGQVHCCYLGALFGAALTGLLISICFQLGPQLPGQPFINTPTFHTAVTVQVHAWLFIEQEHECVLQPIRRYTVIILQFYYHCKGHTAVHDCIKNVHKVGYSVHSIGNKGMLQNMQVNTSSQP